MLGNSSLLAAVLTIVSVVALILLVLFCLRCKRKSKIIHEEHQIYNPQTFQREGSMFAVTRSKAVTRANQITTTTVETRNEWNECSEAASDNQSGYGNIRDSHTGSLEHTYVDPLPMSLYENDEQNKNRISDHDPGVYANISPDDEDDYENSEFLKQQEDEEPDYVNENGEC
ncbi:uncharacterized protein LOC119030898 isoform X2 [Acanthopagrus latus]|nr:uncharacterized protein LOC119030898 isoform X2 [Acanthopagrus latus]